MPEKNINNNKVINYLISRGINKDIIIECINKDYIYESKQNHNAVFVGYDQNHNAKFASVRATNPSRYMHDCYGSNKAYSFQLADKKRDTDTIHIFESAIDLLSYATILKMNNVDYHKENLISLAGVYQPSKIISESKMPLALALFVYNNKKIKKIVLHLDNDQAGRNATLGLTNAMKNVYEVIDDPPKIGKDFNDYLCYLKNIKNLNKERGNNYEL